MADLDAELLALADGDSAEEGPTTGDNKADSDSSVAGSPGDRAASNELSERAAKATASTSKGGRKRRSDVDDDGQVSSRSSASSPQARSASMSESEENASATETTGKDLSIFPIDGKFYSEKDKTEIMSLSEVRREAILAERAQILERKQQDQVLRRLFDGYKDKTDDPKKRKAGAAELEDGQRKSSRQKTTLGGRKVGETSDAILAYKKQREQKGVLAEQRKNEASERKARKGSVASDADADGESDVDWDERQSKNARHDTPPRFEEPANLHDFERIRVGRAQFGQVCFYPGFERAIQHCYARASIGLDKDTSENVYRLARIEGFTEGKPYALEGPNGKLFTTNQYAVVSVGKAKKEWPFIACSNSAFTEREYDRYKKTLVTEGFTLPTKTSLAKKIDDINKLLNHKFTEKELQIKLQRSGVLQQKQMTIDRHALYTRRKDAEHRGDKVAMDDIDAELASLEGPKLAFGTSLVKSEPAVPTGKTQQERLADLNRANRKFNTQNVRRAQLAERKAEAVQRAAIERGEAVANPFARVKVRATTHHDVNALHVPKVSHPEAKADDDDLFGSDRSRAATPLSGTNTPLKRKPDAKFVMPDLLRPRVPALVDNDDTGKSTKQLRLEDWRRRARATVRELLMGPDPAVANEHLNFDDDIEPETWAFLESLNKEMAARELPV